MMIQTDKINSSSIHTVDSSRSLKRLERAAGWHYPSFLWRTLPPAVKNALRELRARIITLYLTRHFPRNKEFDQSLEDAMASASLSIIVPVHDAPEMTRRCLMSLQKYAPQAEIILVDDASKLEKTKNILEDFSSRNSWKLIRHPEPLRHSAACGAGASLATRPYLCLLNSDTVVTPRCWRPITQVFEDNPKIGVAGPSTSRSGNSQTLPLAKCARHYLNDNQICEYAQLLSTECSDPLVTDLPWVCGFALFIRRSLWELVGGFDRNIPDFYNDIELSTRILGAGYRAVWVRNSYIHHLGGESYPKAVGCEFIAKHAQAAEEYIKQKYRHCDR